MGAAMGVAPLAGGSLGAGAAAAAALFRGRHGLLAGLRRLLLVLTLVTTVITVVLALLDSRLPPPARGAVPVVAVVWWLWWRWGYHRGGFPAWGELVEIVFVVTLALLGGEVSAAAAPVSAGIFVRSLYGSSRGALVRAVVWWAVDQGAESVAFGLGLEPIPTSTEQALWQLLSFILWTGLMRAVASTLVRQELLAAREQALWRAATGLAAAPGGDHVHQLAVVAALDLVGRPAARAQIMALEDGVLRALAAEPGPPEGAVAVADLPAPLRQGLAAGQIVQARADGCPGLAGLPHLHPDAPGVVQLPLTVGDQRWGALVVEVAPPLRPGVADALQTLTSSVSLALCSQALTEDLQRQALRDPLTGLANRALLRERAAQAVARSRRESRRAAVLLVDLDGFKSVNDALGHAAGDQLLMVVADRLRASVRPADTVARLGGDEFAVLLDGVDTTDDARRAACRVLAALAEPVELEGRSLVITGSVGVAVWEDPLDVDALLRDADTAMYVAKHRGKGRFAVYEPRMRSTLARRQDLEAALRDGLAAGGFRAHYQPIVDLRSGRTVAVEALVRWHRTAGRATRPGAFLPAAERSGQILPLGRAVLEQACRQLRSWTDDLGPGAPRTVGVNLSPVQLRDDRLAEDVEDILSAAGLPPTALELEVDQAALAGDGDAVRARLVDLHDLGVRVALERFGSGSSLELLRRLPIDTLKMDRSWVDDLTGNPDGRAFAQALLGFAASLELRVVAEGVERPEQLDALRHQTGTLAQGNHLSPALPPDRATAYLRSRVALPATG